MRPQTSRLLILLLIPSLLVAGRKKSNRYVPRKQKKKTRNTQNSHYRQQPQPPIDPIQAFLAQKAKEEKIHKKKKKKYIKQDPLTESLILDTSIKVLNAAKKKAEVAITRLEIKKTGYEKDLVKLKKQRTNLVTDYKKQKAKINQIALQCALNPNLAQQLIDAQKPLTKIENTHAEVVKKIKKREGFINQINSQLTTHK